MAPVVPAPLRGELNLPVTLELKALKFLRNRVTTDESGNC